MKNINQENWLRIVQRTYAIPFDVNDSGSVTRLPKILVEGSVSLQSTPPNSRCDVSPPSDLELVDVMACGDHRGYELLTKKYQNRLFKSILLRVGCAVAAEEIVQDAFVRAFLNLRSFRRDSNFYTWLYRIALNSSRSDYRRRQRMLPLDCLGQDSDRLSTAIDDSPLQSVERAEERREVRQAMLRLDEGYRTILILREFEGFDYQAIAAVLGIKIGTVRSRLFRAREQLRRELSVYLAESKMAADRPGMSSAIPLR